MSSNQSPCWLPEYWLVKCNPYINWVLVGFHLLYTANKQGEMMTWNFAISSRGKWLGTLCRCGEEAVGKCARCDWHAGNQGLSTVSVDLMGRVGQKRGWKNLSIFFVASFFSARAICFMILVNGTSWLKIGKGQWLSGWKFGNSDFPSSFQPWEFSSTLRWQYSKKMFHHSTVHFSIPTQWLVWSHPLLFCRSVLVSSHYLGAWVPAASNCFLNYGSASDKPSVWGKMVA